MTSPTEFFATGALHPTPTDVRVHITGKPGSGKTLVAGVILEALEGLPSTTVCLDQRLRELKESMAPGYLGHERARLKEHPLFVGLAEVPAPVPPPAGPTPRVLADYTGGAALKPVATGDEAELRMIDTVLARRPALADCPNRAVAIEKAIATAGLYDLANSKLESLAAEHQKTKLDLQEARAERDDYAKQAEVAKNKLADTLASLAILEGRLSMSQTPMYQGAAPLPEPYATAGGLGVQVAGDASSVTLPDQAVSRIDFSGENVSVSIEFFPPAA